MDGWMGGWMDGWLAGWVDGWMGGWMDGWVDGWMGGWIDIKLILSVAGVELRCQALAIHPPWKPKQVHISLITSICFRMSFIQEGQLSFSLFLSLPRSSLICFCH